MLLVAIAVGLVSAANNGALDKQIKLGIQYYFSTHGVKAKFYDLKFKNWTITASKLNIQSGTGITKIDNIKILTFLSSDFVLSLKLQPTQLKIIDENSKQLMEALIDGSLTADINGTQNTELNLPKINIIETIRDTNKKPIESGSGKLIYTRSRNHSSLEGELKFGQSIKISILPSEKHKDNIELHAENIPILFYKVADNILPNNNLLKFLRSSIQNGYIKNADVSFSPNANKLSKESLYGTAQIVKLDYKYDDDLPILSSMDVDVKIEGSKSQFIINKAYCSEILLSKGIIDMEWKGQDNTILYINASGDGPAKSLTGFIHKDEHDSMNKAKIDLRKINGRVSITVYTEIPLKPGTENLYDIRAEIPNASLDIFDSYVKLRRAKISGIFDGKHLKLHGVGKLNNFNSDLNFIYNIENQSEFNHRLDIRTHFKTRVNKSTKEQKIAFISLLGGDSIVDIQYLNKNSKGYIKVDSDISNLELYFDKLGIRKAKNAPARVRIDGLFDDPTQGIINFHTYNDKDLSIKGDVKIENNKAEIDLNEIKYKETNISGRIHLFSDIVIAELKGKTLDLSDADMLQFLEKEREGGNSKLKINIDKVKLKDNIWLDDLKLMFECDSSRCFSGYIDSKIGSRDIEMLLTAENDREDWLIKCGGNAGAFLKGIGAYDSMKLGSMVLKISTSRKEVRPGEIIPILDGTFTFERFKLQDTPAITSLVSFVSLPGFIGIISGNKDISFSGMNGNFSFENSLLKINNSFATGPYFDFSMKGTIDTKNRLLDLNGHVNPALYGASKLIGSIPIIGRIFTGNKKHRGLVSGTYQIKEKY